MENTVKQTAVMDRTGVFDEGGKNRYELTIEYKGRDYKKVLIICINPASDSIEYSDTTTNYITNNLYKMGYSTITICNLFSRITSKLHPSEITDNSDNLKYIEEVLKREFDNIIVGFGNTFKGNKKVAGEKEKLYKILSTYKTKLVEIVDVDGRYKDLQTIHPLFAGQRFSGNWKLIKHNIPKAKKVVKGDE